MQLSRLSRAPGLSAADLEQLDHAMVAEEVRVAPEIMRAGVSSGELVLR
jgi:hypothetical protein